MKKHFYREWDWEYDFGVDPLPDGQPLPNKFAVAYYDRLERLYRAEVWEELPSYDKSPGTMKFDIFRRDYFCDVDGNILQKRSLGEDHEVELIVDFEYDTERGRVREVAWWPDSNTCKSIERAIRPRPAP